MKRIFSRFIWSSSCGVSSSISISSSCNNTFEYNTDLGDVMFFLNKSRKRKVSGLNGILNKMFKFGNDTIFT